MPEAKREFKTLTFEIKAVDETTGTFEGYASTFGNKDSYNDIVHKGAFIESLKKRKPKLLWQHKSDEPIGVYEEVREDATGLFVKGNLEIESDFGKRVYGLMKKGALEGLSIGYSVPEDGFNKDNKNKVRNLTKLDLFEVSVVTFPANSESLVSSVKEKGEDMKEEKTIEQFECMKDFENFLKEPHRLNTQERKTFISKLKEFSKKRDVEETEAKKRDAEAKKDETKKLVIDYLENLINKTK